MQSPIVDATDVQRLMLALPFLLDEAGLRKHYGQHGSHDLALPSAISGWRPGPVMRPASHSGLRPVQLLSGWWTWAPACTTQIGAVPILEMIWEILGFEENGRAPNSK